MRALFLLLVLANVAFFAWSRYVAPPEAAADPVPLGREIEPQKLKVIAPSELPAIVARPAPAPIVLKCIEWGGFTLADASNAQAALEPLQLGARLAQRRSDESAGWWVFIPPQGSRPAAQKKAAELKALAVDDYFVVQDEGPYRWALSLGVFRSEEAAQARLAALRSQGVRSAQVGARETTVSKVWLQVKAVDAGLYARLKEVARAIEGSELRECSQ
ncbi:MAG TPA: SPOR domain-containing protein [Burkholderiales bacterium]|nr:SPOR domain-containing protein [Burkholderiales bacterium]